MLSFLQLYYGVVLVQATSGECGNELRVDRNMMMTVVGTVFTKLFISTCGMVLAPVVSVKSPNGKVMLASYPHIELGSPECIPALIVVAPSRLLYCVAV